MPYHDAKQDQTEVFQFKLEEETACLRTFFKENRFGNQRESLGLELEFLLLKPNLTLAHLNEDFVKNLDNPFFSQEGHTAQLEMHTQIHQLTESGVDGLIGDLEKNWKICAQHAAKNNQKTLFMGSYPIGDRNDFSGQHLTPQERYRLIDAALMDKRKNTPINIDILSKTPLHVSYKHLGMMGSINSLQVHLQPTADKLASTYNNLLFVAGPLIAASSNAAYLLQKKLWSETRIPVFEKLFTVKRSDGENYSRASFGENFIQESPMELFEDNFQFYPIVFPRLKDSMKEELCHLRLHNSTIYRWIRPVIDFTDGKPALRYEIRFFPSGPTLVDMQANIVFLIGLTLGLDEVTLPTLNKDDFDRVKSSFYACAREGLNAGCYWIDKKVHSARDLILHELLPLAENGLIKNGYDIQKYQYYLDIIKERVRSEQTGSSWQEKYTEAHSLREMTKFYLKNQEQGNPAHSWTY